MAGPAGASELPATGTERGDRFRDDLAGLLVTVRELQPAERRVIRRAFSDALPFAGTGEPNEQSYWKGLGRALVSGLSSTSSAAVLGNRACEPIRLAMTASDADDWLARMAGRTLSPPTDLAVWTDPSPGRTGDHEALGALLGSVLGAANAPGASGDGARFGQDVGTFIGSRLDG